MQIDWSYRNAVPAGTSATSLMLTGATLLDDVQGPPPPPPKRHPIIHHFGHAGLCRAQIKHPDQFRLSSYQLESAGLCGVQDPMGCQLTGCTETLYQLELAQLH